MYNDSKVTAETESSAFQESSPNGLVAPLTKRPIEATTSSKLQKRKKKENEEDLLIKKALQCMEKAGREKKKVLMEMMHLEITLHLNFAPYTLLTGKIGLSCKFKQTIFQAKSHFDPQNTHTSTSMFSNFGNPLTPMNSAPVFLILLPHPNIDDLL